MKLLFLDPFESLTPNVSLYVSEPSRAFLGPSLSGNGGYASVFSSSHYLVAGIVSPVMLSLMPQASSSNSYDMYLGPTGSLTAGKYCASANVSVDVSRIPTGIVRLFGVTADNTQQIISINKSGVIAFNGASANSGITDGTTFSLELLIDMDSGTFDVFFNDALLFSGTHSFASLDQRLFLKSTGQSPTIVNAYLDDICVLGGTDGPFSTRLGPVRAIRAPLSSMVEANFTPIGAVTNLDAVNKTNLSDASYNRSPSSNDKQDRFKLDVSEIPDDKPIIAVSQNLLYRKTDIGLRGLSSVISGSSGADADKMLLPDRVVRFGGHAQHIVTAKPGGGALDLAALAGMEFGYEVTE